MAERYTLDDLKYLMARLRDPSDGCPWDLKQDYRSIVPHTLEEAYEVADAIERGDYDNLRGELGDLLFQVIFYSQLAREEDRFAFEDVVHGIVSKLIRRHPHVFPEGTLESRVDPGNRPDDVAIKANWERIKAEERRAEGLAATDQPTSYLDGITAGLPAMARAEKLQRRASHHGFDWPDIEPVFDKLQEEVEELKQAWKAVAESEGDRDALEDELGDILFVCVNLARFLGVEADQALRRTNRKFERRFRSMERQLREQGRSMESLPLEKLDELWDRAKQEERVSEAGTNR
ncbi:nucleoside triphosphate pyrophosphohydrolase [Mangrovitalea sediminis]|uniref:nucleoside triphosphate pyrophosphohydrolase n=1 Tax=Mangrovitalea sediminis TaxID=1982043 RepID=UPI0018E9420E|nr:nucleoside triphosphate pyrophosphohydrolase [Mangrovitalea sediminis]